MHFVGPDQLHGFEERLTTDIYPSDFGWTPDWDAPEERIDWWYHNMMSVKQAGIAEASNQLDFDDETGFQATRFLSDHARGNRERPFFLTASFSHPHDPYAIRQRHWDRYEGINIDAPRVAPIPHERMDPHSQRLVKVSAMDEVEITEDDVRRARRAYYGAISYLDDWVGELIRALGTFRLADDTIVVLTSDHGDMLGERGLWYKMCFFEWAVRVPLIFCAPKRFAPRRVSALASLIDLLPTLLELGRPASGPAAEIETDGQSLAAALDGGALGERTVLGEYMAEGALAPILMIRRGRWKYVWSEADPPMLLDLERDPDELENLAARPEHAATAAAFEAGSPAVEPQASVRKDPREPAGAAPRLWCPHDRAAHGVGLPAGARRLARVHAQPSGPERGRARPPLPERGLANRRSAAAAPPRPGAVPDRHPARASALRSMPQRTTVYFSRVSSSTRSTRTPMITMRMMPATTCCISRK
ncbi:MAG: choline-sulfatase, partial [Geminicoccales bacterium]